MNDKGSSPVRIDVMRGRPEPLYMIVVAIHDSYLL